MALDGVLQNQILKVAEAIEHQLDEEIQKFDDLDGDGLEKLREERLKQLKKQAQQRQEWMAKGHGEYDEIAEEKEFFEVTKKSPNMVVHFFRDSTPRCKIFDHHLKILATKHIEARFVKLNVERCPFLTERLRIRVIPTIGLVKDSITKDFIRGFTDLGNCDDFSTDLLEWRIAQSGVIDYQGDLLTPPDKKKTEKQSMFAKKRTIRGRDDSDDSGSDLDL